MTSMTAPYPSPAYITPTVAPMIAPQQTNSILDLSGTMPQAPSSILSGMGQAPAQQQQQGLGYNLDSFSPQAQQGQETMNSRFFLEFINIQETPGYQEHYNRHYQPQMNNDAIVANFVEDIARAKGNPGNNVLAIHASSMFGLNMSGNSSNRIYIPDGWGTKRMKFLMLVREENIQFKKTMMTYINGFTDNYGISTTHGQTSIDPNMKFYINSLVTLAEETHATPSGPQKYWNVVQATQVVDGSLVSMDHTGTMSNNVHLLRPSDIIGGLSARSDAETGFNNWLSVDGRMETVGGLSSHFNNMSNNLPTSYLSRLVTPILGSMSGLSPRPGIGGMVSTMSEVAQRSEFSLQNSTFLRYMSRQTGVPLTTQFSLSLLERLDPTIGQRTKHFPIVANNYMQMHAMSMDSTPWNYVGNETEIATKLVSTIPSLLWENFASCASFSITNASPNHIPIFKWEFLQFITPTGLPVFQEKLRAAIENVILIDISKNNQFVVDVQIFVDVGGEIQIGVSIEGQPHKRFTSPAFGCGILNPIHTSDANMANDIVNGFGMMVDGISAYRGTERSLASTARNFNF